MRLSFSTGTFYHRSLAYNLRLARELGIDGVELDLGLGYLLRGIQGLRHTATRAGMPILSVHPPLVPLPGWSKSATYRLPQVTAVARELGARTSVVHVPRYRELDSPRAQIFKVAIQQALQVGGDVTMLTLESTQVAVGHPRIVLDDLRALADLAGEQKCGITLDTCHVGVNGDDLLEAYAIVRPHLRNVHLSDLRWQGEKRVRHALPGEGILPLREFLGALASDDFAGSVTLELNPREVGLISRHRALKRLRQAFDFVRDSTGTPAMPRADAW